MDAVVTPAAAPSGEPGHRSPTLSDEERSRLSSEICRISKAWVSQVAQMQQVDAAFAKKLASCTTTVAAAELCGSWMAHRVDAAVVAQHRLLEVWLESMSRAERRRLADEYGPGDENG